MEAEKFQPQAADREQGGEKKEHPDEGDEGRMEVENGEKAGTEQEVSSDETDEINSEWVSSLHKKSCKEC